ncbi:hypothetical protein MNBD_DELTA03-260 [hydrothermal vent metagenome]|uniref:PBS lyase n=1 Tax=hydrothermal vent metagenome TaxID=652676 RepID=A0A3B0VSL3_9ZZZZ
MGKSNSQPVRPWCPFCGENISPPVEPQQRKMDEFKLGRCQCGALYVSDPTGHNVGAAMVECLVRACDDNWDLAWDLDADEDYFTNRLDNYDEPTHQIVETRNLDGRAVRGVLYFVRVNSDINDLTAKISRKGEKTAATSSSPAAVSIPAMEPLRKPDRQKQRATKLMVKELTDEENVAALVDLCFDDKRTIRFMQRLLYEPDYDQRMRYINVIAQVCGRYSTRHSGTISDLLHRLYEACSDSAATHWGLVEVIGAIIAERTDIFGAFARHLLMFRQVPATRVSVLWSLSEIARRRPAIIRDAPFYCLFNMLKHPDPATRGHAALLFGLIQADEVKNQIKDLLDDNALVVVYHHGRPQTTTVKQIAQEALKRIDEKEKGENNESE